MRNWFRTDGDRFLSGLTEEESADLQTFEGNAQGLRVLCSAEYHPYEGGMRLTYATLGAFMKYPWTAKPAVEGRRPKRDKYGVFTSEVAFFHEIAEAVGLLKNSGEDWYCRHPLVHLMEAADDFCYGIIDLEDGLEMSILRWDEILEVVKDVLDPDSLADLAPEFERVREGRRPPLLRGKVIDAYVEAAAEAFVKNGDKFLSGQTHELIELCSPEISKSVKAAKQLARERIFKHPRKIELEIGSYNVISTLLQVLCEAVTEWVAKPVKHSFRCERVMDLIGEKTFHPLIHSETPPQTPKYLALMRVIDFVSGMTDHYATYLAKQFNGMAESR